MIMISVEKPGSPEEILEHHGTKGMKWGVRNNTHAFNTKNPTRQMRTDSIKRARAGNIKRATDFRTERDPGKRAQKKQAFLKNPDRATALRMTRGEKVVLGILAVGLPGPGTVGVGLAVGTQVGIRKHVEKKQARGGYN